MTPLSPEVERPNSLNSEISLADQTRTSQPVSDYWLFSMKLDLMAFLGSALLAFLLIAVGWFFQILHEDTPEWIWVSTILMIDVAHVYATGFRVYFDREELKRRPILYGAVPVLCFLVGSVLYSEGSFLFWRVLAYLAVFHFVRQQYGWVMLYRAKRKETARWEHWLDSLTIYLCTIYPLVYWHCHLPRAFHWFHPNDFLATAEWFAQMLAPIYWIALALYLINSMRKYLKGNANPGKDLVVLTTAICWYLGIVSWNSDYVFTVTNVIIHGVPYIILIAWYQQNQNSPSTWNTNSSQSIEPIPNSNQTPTMESNLSCDESRNAGISWSTWGRILGIIWMLAYMEMLFWDKGIWHKREWLFGSSFPLELQAGWLAPLLAVPQLTHYVLDGFIWKRRSNPNLSRIIERK